MLPLPPRAHARRFLSLVLLLTLLAAASIGTVSAQDTEDTVTVSDAEELQEVGGDLDGDYALTDDIDASEVRNFNPIGSRENPFTGTFDGGGHNITGLTMERGGNTGLFAALGEGGVVRDVGLRNADVEGNGNVGGVAGFSRGEIVRTYVTGTVEGSGNRVGGIVGWQRGGNVTDSYSKASVSGQVDVGGLVGQGNGRIAESYAAGSVSGAQAGALVGQLGLEYQLSSRVSVLRDSYWIESRSSDAVGRARSGDGETVVEGVEGLSPEEMRGDAARENMPALNFGSTWETKPDDYPVLAWQTGVLPSGLPAPGFGFFAAAAALACAAGLARRLASEG